jgi:hypothetical protein
VVVYGVADDDEWAPIERPDEIATAEVDRVKDKRIAQQLLLLLVRDLLLRCSSPGRRGFLGAGGERVLMVGGRRAAGSERRGQPGGHGRGCGVPRAVPRAERENAEKAGLNYLLETVRALLESEWAQWDKDNCVLVADSTAEGLESLHLHEVLRRYPRVRV